MFTRSNSVGIAVPPTSTLTSCRAQRFPQAGSRRWAPLTLDDAPAVLTSNTGMGHKELLAAPFGLVGSRLRWLALDWLPRATGLPRVELARSLGLHATVLWRIGQRLRAEREVDEELRELSRRCDEALVEKGGGP